MKPNKYQRVPRDSLEGPQFAELQPLRLADDCSDEPELFKYIEHSSASRNSWAIFGWDAIRNVVFIGLTVVDVMVCSVLLFHYFREGYHTDPRTLRMPNQYYGLDTTLDGGAPSLSNSSVITFPGLLQQITQGDPNYVYPDDPRRYRSDFGTLSPEDRPLYVSASVSTIAQFRVRDYRMETCVLKLMLPSERMFSPLIESTSVGRQRDWAPFDGSMEIEVWKLDPISSKRSGDWIDPRTLSFRNRPRRGSSRAFAKLAIQGAGEASSPRFRCARDEVLSFELTCQGCALDVWQDKQLPAVGLIIEQFWSDGTAGV